MSEPAAVARALRTVAPGVVAWSVHDERIDFRSDAYAVRAPEGVVLIDPLPLATAPRRSLGEVIAIVITIESHQRSSWRYRQMFGAPVWAPRGAEGLDSQPDLWFDARDQLPGPLRAIHAPGPCDASFALLYEPARRRQGVLFCGDILIRGGRGPLRFFEDDWQDEPQLTRETARRFLGLPISAICPGHGLPVVDGARDAIRRAIELDEKERGGFRRRPADELSP